MTLPEPTGYADATVTALKTGEATGGGIGDPLHPGDHLRPPPTPSEGPTEDDIQGLGAEGLHRHEREAAVATAEPVMPGLDVEPRTVIMFPVRVTIRSAT